MLMRKYMLAIAALLGAIALAPTAALAANHDVTWGFGVTQAPLDVVVGDTITFNYGTGHDVRLFPDATAFGGCDFTNATFLQGTGPYVYDVVSAGSFYFGCGIGVHCSSGNMSLQVTATAPSVPGVEPLLLAMVLGTAGLAGIWVVSRGRRAATVPISTRD